ncbi:DUF222 domain-containing protein [Aeromicrobium sp. CF4.19]|uniref:HNH endonuclease n=1 Tax=Aeromicrobium sp. CF4.19 TaxID=3373082 RepID=UPI003EE47F53
MDAALREGRLCAYRVRLIAGAAWRLHEDTSVSSLDEHVVAYAETHTPTQLRQWLRRRILRLEPEHAARRRAEAREQRGIWFSHGDDAMAMMHALIPAAEALLLERELTIAAKLARTGRAGETDGRTLDQARADVLVDRLLGRDGMVPVGRGAFHIGVTVPADTLLGLGHEPGASVDGRLALDPALVRELATMTDTLFSRLVTDPLGGVLDTTELGRFPSARLERALVLIDGVCAFPTCNAPAASCDTDHVVPHSRGGPTTGRNLVHLCRRHHGFKTRGQLRTAFDAGGGHHWQLPDGPSMRSRTHLPRYHRTATRTTRAFASHRPTVEVDLAW